MAVVQQPTPGQIAEIVCYADSTHYLIRFEDAAGKQQMLTDKNGKILRLASLAEAKYWLKSLGHKHASLYMESAYDEFATMETAPDKMIIPLH